VRTRPRHRLLLAAPLVAGALLAASPAATAHDTWLSLSPGGTDGGVVRLELGVGPRFPLREGGPAASSIDRAECQAPGAAREQPLLARQQQERYLELRARLDAAQGLACWLELKAHEAELTPELVEAYFTEIRPPAEQAQAWGRQRARGIPWRESYRKFARIEVPPAVPPPPGTMAALRRPRGLPLEIVPAGDEVVQVGRPASFRLLLDGKPLPQHWVEFVNERSPVGVWRQSDAAGEVQLALPFGGRWLVRAVRLTTPAADAEPWRSLFATLLLQVR